MLSNDTAPSFAGAGVDMADVPEWPFLSTDRSML